MIVKYKINYGGYIGADEEYFVDVEDDATDEEIEEAIQGDFEREIENNCYWERIE